MKNLNLPSNCNSLLCKHLNTDIFNQLINKETSNGYNFLQVINSGLQNIDSGIGVYAGDDESYQIFAPLLDPIIEDYHGYNKNKNHQTDLLPENLNTPNPDPESQYIISTRIRVARNLQGFPLGAAVTKGQRDQIEALVKNSLNNFTNDLSGVYYPLLGMTKEAQQNLIDDHFLFKEGDRFLEKAGLNRDWPNGRGIYHNDDKTFLIWINEEDQLRIISMQKGGNIKAVFTRLVKALKQLETTLSFSYSKHLGYITSCPSNLGTAMRASVHIALPYLHENMDQLKKITDHYHLQIRGIHGEHSENKQGIFDISNRRRLGITEVESVTDMYKGVIALIKKEKSLSKIDNNISS